MKPFEYRGISTRTGKWIYGWYVGNHYYTDPKDKDMKCCLLNPRGAFPIIPETLGIKVETAHGRGVYTGDRYWDDNVDEEYTVFFDDVQFQAQYEYEGAYEQWQGVGNFDNYLGTIHDRLLKEQNNENS